MVGSNRLVPCDDCPPGEDPPVFPPDADFQTLTNSWSIRSQFSQPDVSFVEEYNYEGAWVALVNPDKQTISNVGLGYSIYAYSVDSTATGLVTWEKDSSPPTIFSAATGGKYKRPGTNVVLIQNLAYKANEFVFNPDVSSYEYTQRSDVQRVAYTFGGRCGPQGTYLVDVPAPGFDVGVPAAAVSPFTLRWIGVSTINITGLSLTMTASGGAQKPWNISISNGTLTLSNNSGISRSFTGSITTVRNEINAWPTSGTRYFTAGYTTSAFPTTGGLANARISDFPDYFRSGLTSTTCTTNIPIIYAGTYLAPSSTGLGYGTVVQNTKFVEGAGFTDDESGAKLFLSATRYRKETTPFVTNAGYIEDYALSGPDPTATSLGGSFTSGPSVLTEALAITEGFGSSFQKRISTTSVLSASCSTDCTPVCPPGSFNLGGFGVSNCTGLPGDPGLIPQHQNCNFPNNKCACVVILEEYETFPYREYLMTQTINGTSILS